MKKFLPAIAANISAALSEILLMASAAWLIASAALQPPLSALSVGVTLVRTAGISRAALRYADRFFSHKIIFSLLNELREKIFLTAAAKLPLLEGELLRDLTHTADLLKDFLPKVIAPLSAAAACTLLLTSLLAPKINFFSLILPAIFFANLLAAFFFSDTEPDDSEYRGKILDFSAARDELKIYGRGPALRQLDLAAKNFGQTLTQKKSRRENFRSALEIFNVAATCLILFELFPTVDKIFFVVWAMILISVQEIFSRIPEAIRTYKEIKKIQPTFHEIKKIPATRSENFAVELDNVSFSYDKKNFVLKNFSLQVERGETLAILGESGSGKTTLLRLMLGLFAPDSGTIAVGGKISAATSTNFIFSPSARFNFLALHENISEKKISDALEVSQLAHLDIDLPLGEDGENLSGGERVRLQIALAVAACPEILVLDEPTAGLDRLCAEKLIDSLTDWAAKNFCAMIIITHDLKIAEKFSRRIEL